MSFLTPPPTTTTRFAVIAGGLSGSAADGSLGVSDHQEAEAAEAAEADAVAPAVDSVTSGEDNGTAAGDGEAVADEYRLCDIRITAALAAPPPSSPLTRSPDISVRPADTKIPGRLGAAFFINPEIFKETTQALYADKRNIFARLLKDLFGQQSNTATIPSAALARLRDPNIDNYFAALTTMIFSAHPTDDQIESMLQKIAEGLGNRAFATLVALRFSGFDYQADESVSADLAAVKQQIKNLQLDNSHWRLAEYFAAYKRLSNHDLANTDRTITDHFLIRELINFFTGLEEQLTPGQQYQLLVDLHHERLNASAAHPNVDRIAGALRMNAVVEALLFRSLLTIKDDGSTLLSPAGRVFNFPDR